MNAIRTLLFLVAASAFAGEIPAELEQAIRARDEAVAKKDAATFDRLTTSDFINRAPRRQADEEGGTFGATDGGGAADATKAQTGAIHPLW
jgi:hypothetical protein